MEVLLGIVTIVVLVATHLAAFIGGQLKESTVVLNVHKVREYYHYPETSQRTRQRGTPEQERGSDDTG